MTDAEILCDACHRPIPAGAGRYRLDHRQFHPGCYDPELRQERPTLAKVAAYHTTSTEYPPEHRTVYHDRNDCQGGKMITPPHRVSGTGGKPRCKECIRLG